MSVKRKKTSLYSWEEEAFAEDVGRGSLVWPPRSYRCSFCRRELRSAQGLGGHMNVHRREKAKLKQTTTAPQNHNEKVPALLLGQESSSSDSKNLSCVNNDEDLASAIDGRNNQTKLVLGFDLDSCWNTGGKRRKKTNHVTVPDIMLQGGLDLELKLAS